MGDFTGGTVRKKTEPDKRGNQSVLIPLGAFVFRSVRWYESRSLRMRSGSRILRLPGHHHDV